jgi:hypothetical protein
VNEVNTCNGALIPNARCKQASQARRLEKGSPSMRPVAFGEALSAGTRLTLFSADKPDRFFRVIKFWMDETSGVALALRGGVPTYPSRRRGRQNSLTDLPAN